MYHDDVLCSKGLGKVCASPIASDLLSHAKSSVDGQNRVIEVPSDDACKVVAIVFMRAKFVFDTAERDVGHIVVEAIIFERFKVVDNFGRCSSR